MAGAANDNVRYTVSTIQGVFFVGSGVLLDTIGAGLAVTGIGEGIQEPMDLLADIAIPMHAFFIGINPSKKLATVIGCEVVKIIPFLNIAPTYTLETWQLLQASRKEDRERAKEKASSTRDRMILEQQQRAQAAREQQLIREQMIQNRANEEARIEREAA